MSGRARGGVFSTLSSSVRSRLGSFLDVARSLEARFDGVLGAWSPDLRLREAWGGDLPLMAARRFSYAVYLAAVWCQWFWLDGR